VSSLETDNADAGSLRYLAPEMFLNKKNAVSPALVFNLIKGYMGSGNNFVWYAGRKFTF
jgi:hypothetical protein